MQKTNNSVFELFFLKHNIDCCIKLNVFIIFQLKYPLKSNIQYYISLNLKLPIFVTIDSKIDYFCSHEKATNHSENRTTSTREF